MGRWGWMGVGGVLFWAGWGSVGKYFRWVEVRENEWGSLFDNARFYSTIANFPFP